MTITGKYWRLLRQECRPICLSTYMGRYSTWRPICREGKRLKNSSEKIEMQPDNGVTAFSLYAEDYDRWFDTSAGRNLFKSEVNAVQILMKNIAPPFLEVGVGTGRFAKALGISCGVDPSEAMIEIASQRGITVEKA